MHYNFDQYIERRGGESYKWNDYGDEVLPLWVADMDFAVPEPVIRALHERVAHGIFGYGRPSPKLLDVICDRMQQLYHWTVSPEQIVFLPGLVTGLNVVSRAIGSPGTGVLVQTPVYPPFLKAPLNHGRILDGTELVARREGRRLVYELDYDAFEAAITPRTRLFLLCNPHNPVGYCYTAAELTRMAEICLRHNLVICSDEIHCDLLLGSAQHVPLASLAPEIAERTITLMAPSKTFNLAGLKCSFAIVSNPDLRRRLNMVSAGMALAVNVMGFTAALAAYRDGGEWLDQLRRYLTANRDFVVNYVQEYLPGLTTTVPEATYLAWFDCREAGIEGNPFQFFLKQARVALNDGAHFGPGGEGFVRLNFGCPRSILTQALERMRTALSV
ncbi:MAG: PatB family C-S lyase [Anaerolineae bacterium]|nr:putative C-S lyase [Anaerolineales bacterium]MCQ3977396.1 putative C-S lyase [Anaerolineae bacterium]